MANTLPVSKLIQVTVTLTAVAAQGPNLNSALIVGDSPVIDVVTRYRYYNNLTEVANDFPNTDSEYLAADVFFSQNPQPQNLYIGRWAKTASAGELFCAPLTGAQQLISLWTAITTGAFLVFEDGVPLNVTGLSFASDTNLNGVASTIQTALALLEAGSTVVWNANYERFQITSGTTGAASKMSFLQTSTAVGSLAFAGQPTATHVVVVEGTSIEFVTSGATGSQVNISAVSVAGTVANLLAFLNSSSDSELVKMTYLAVGTTIYMLSKSIGTGGNAYTLTTTDGNITPTAPTGGSAGTDISGTLGGAASTTSGAYVANGIAAESALSGVQAIEAVFANWYGLAFAAGAVSGQGTNGDVADSDYLAVAAYIEGDANRHLFAVTTSEGAAIVAPDTTSIGALLHEETYNRTFYQWSSTNPFAAISMLGLGCTVNFNGSYTTINFAWKSQPGVVAENLNSSQAASLDANCYNYYANFNNGSAITVNGFLSSGHFIDEIWNSDWFGSTIQTAVFNLLKTTATKIPQTDAGMHQISTTIEAVCNQGVNNGFLAPGIWNSSGFGQISEGDFLPKGYYIYQPPINLQTESARAARQSVAFQVAAKEAGAVNDVIIGVVVNQ